MKKLDRIKYFRDAYNEMAQSIFRNESGGGNRLNPFEYNIIHNDKISAHRYMGMVEAFETVIKILEDDKTPD